MIEVVIKLEAGDSHYHRRISLPSAPFVGLQLWFAADVSTEYGIEHVWWIDSRPNEYLVHVESLDVDPGDDEMLKAGWVPGEFQFA